jgi:anti-repressor protein
MEEQNGLRVFEHEEFGKVRAIVRDREPWFIAADVCKCLELSNVGQAVAFLDEDEKASYEGDLTNITNNDVYLRGRNPLIISEAGMYSLILKSRKPEAKAVKRWITHDVIPAIRKHGAYLTPAKLDEVSNDNSALVKMLVDMQEAHERTMSGVLKKLEEVEVQVMRDRPKVEFAEGLELSEELINVGHCAKLIKQSTGHDTGQNRFFGFLRDTDFVHKGGCQRNLPMQRSLDAGLMKIYVGMKKDKNGKPHFFSVAKITANGLKFFINLFQKIMQGE